MVTRKSPPRATIEMINTARQTVHPFFFVINLHRCIFYGDLYGCRGDNPQPAMNQLGDFVRARKLFAYGELRDYWDHGEL